MAAAVDLPRRCATSAEPTGLDPSARQLRLRLASGCLDNAVKFGILGTVLALFGTTFFAGSAMAGAFHFGSAQDLTVAGQLCVIGCFVAFGTAIGHAIGGRMLQRAAR
jgi:hypothetical protein